MLGACEKNARPLALGSFARVATLKWGFRGVGHPAASALLSERLFRTYRGRKSLHSMLGNEIWKFCQGAEVAFGTFFFTMHRSVYGLGAIDPRCEIHVRTHSPVDVGTKKISTSRNEHPGLQPPFGFLPLGPPALGFWPFRPSTIRPSPLEFAPLEFPPLGFSPLGLSPLGLSPLGLSPLGLSPLGLPPPSGRGSSGRGSSGRGSSGRGSSGRGSSARASLPGGGT